MGASFKIYWIIELVFEEAGTGSEWSVEIGGGGVACAGEWDGVVILFGIGVIGGGGKKNVLV